MSDLVAFLRARLDDDEANLVYPSVHSGECASVGGPPGPFPCDCGVPERMMREVEAKRKILEAYEGAFGWDLPEGVSEGRDPDARERDQAVKDELEGVVRALAAVYSDHADFDKWDWV